MRPVVLVMVLAVHALIGARWCDAQTTVLGKPYTKLASRVETREAFLKSLGGSNVEWGRWWMLAPFAHEKGGKDIATAYPPEAQLAAMKADAAGPDLKAEYDGAGGRIAWHEVEDKALDGGEGKRYVDFEGLLKLPERPKNMAGYLYRQIVAAAPAQVPVNVGSDDGVRIWLNGELVLDANVERPMNVGDNRIVLRVAKGVNHLLVKVSQGAGEWSAAVVPDFRIDPVMEAALDYRLDEDFPEGMTPYYRIVTIPTPAGEEIEVGGIDVLPDGRPILCTRRGDVWIVEGAFEMPPVKARWKKFATGLQEPLGVAVRIENGKTVVYCAQRAELTRLADADGDDVADAYEAACSQWEISGNYHEYAFGPVFDRDGYAWVNLNLAHTDGDGTVMGTKVRTRGWAVKIGPDGAMHKVADGLRSPDGLGIWSDGQMFFTDNQGDYVATNKLSPLIEGSFQGHQASLKYREDFGPEWKAQGKTAPAYTPPAVWFPYKKMGQSACGFMLDSTAGKFGPFAGQFFVGEQTLAWVTRASIEKLSTPEGNTVYQGACYPFREGLASGVHRVCFAPDGSLLVGMTDRGWGSTGPKRFGLQRLVWTGRTPFEIREMNAKPDGFVVEFTRAVGDDAVDAGKYSVQSYTYEYRPDYGSPEMDTKPHRVVSVERVSDRSVRLHLDELRTGPMGYVHELRVSGVNSLAGADAPAQGLMHNVAYYTVQIIPDR